VTPKINSIERVVEVLYGANSIAGDGEAARRPRESQLDCQ